VEVILRDKWHHYKTKCLPASFALKTIQSCQQPSTTKLIG